MEKRNSRRSSSSTTPTKGAQTGSRRVLNDTIVTFSNCINNWIAYYSTGSLLINGMVSLNEKDVNEFHTKCVELGKILSKMNSLIGDMGKQVEKLHNLGLLEKDSGPPFITWNYELFENVARKIFEALSAENDERRKLGDLLTKFFIVEFDSDLLFASSLAWNSLRFYQPPLTIEYEAMLVECRLKTY